MTLRLPQGPLTRDDLLRPFHDSERPREQWLIGTEAEKFLVHADGTPAAVEGPGGVFRVLEDLSGRGWKPKSEYAGGPTIGLVRGGASISLEPGGQFELSGAPLATLAETERELVEHRTEVEEVLAPYGLSALGLGFHPTSECEAFQWVPKRRYAIMREYLPTVGKFGVDMMLRTCTVQANLDYADEQDAMLKLRAAIRVSTLVAAIFANAPFKARRRSGEKSERVRVWTSVDPKRSGLLPFSWRDDLGYEDYVDWALDAPMFLLERGERIVKNTGQTFRDFLTSGFQGETATPADWVTHLNTLFPEVRLKRTLELRGADGQRTAETVEIPALWKGLLYDEQALAATFQLGADWTHDELDALREAVAHEGLAAEFHGKTLRDFAETLVGIAHEGLARLVPGEEKYLDATLDRVQRGESPADRVLREVPGETIDPAALIAATRF